MTDFIKQNLLFVEIILAYSLGLVIMGNKCLEFLKKWQNVIWEMIGLFLQFSILCLKELRQKYFSWFNENSPRTSSKLSSNFSFRFKTFIEIQKYSTKINWSRVSKESWNLENRSKPLIKSILGSHQTESLQLFDWVQNPLNAT